MSVGTSDWRIAFEIALPEVNATLYNVAESRQRNLQCTA